MPRQAFSLNRAARGHIIPVYIEWTTGNIPPIIRVPSGPAGTLWVRGARLQVLKQTGDAATVYLEDKSGTAICSIPIPAASAIGTEISSPALKYYGTSSLIAETGAAGNTAADGVSGIGAGRRSVVGEDGDYLGIRVSAPGGAAQGQILLWIEVGQVNSSGAASGNESG